MPLEAMSSIIAIGLLGKLFQILFLQHFHEIYIMTLQCGPGGVRPTIAVHCGCQIFKMAAKGRENE